jgi:hypothetical protein
MRRLALFILGIKKKGKRKYQWESKLTVPTKLKVYHGTKEANLFYVAQR